MPTELCSLPSTTSLYSFIQSNIQADLSFVSAARNVIDTVVKILHSPLFPYNVAEVIKTGSLAQGTALKHNMSDIDLVVYLNNCTIESLIQNMREILTAIDIVLRKSLTNYRMISQDEFRLGIQLKADGQTFDVDLLPGIPSSLYGIYRNMSCITDHRIREHYSVSFAKQQKDFIQTRQTKLKSLFQLMKYWIKVDLKQYSSQKFPSYIMTLIVIHTWEKYGSPSSFDISAGFKAVLETLNEHEKIQRVWHYNYDSSIMHLFMNPKGRYLIDPANPSVDVLNSVSDWQRVALAARNTLQSPIVRNISVKLYWY